MRDPPISSDARLLCFLCGAPASAHGPSLRARPCGLGRSPDRVLRRWKAAHFYSQLRSRSSSSKVEPRVITRPFHFVASSSFSPLSLGLAGRQGGSRESSASFLFSGLLHRAGVERPRSCGRLWGGSAGLVSWARQCPCVPGLSFAQELLWWPLQTPPSVALSSVPPPRRRPLRFSGQCRPLAKAAHTQASLQSPSAHLGHQPPTLFLSCSGGKGWVPGLPRGCPLANPRSRLARSWWLVGSGPELKPRRGSPALDLVTGRALQDEWGQGIRESTVDSVEPPAFLEAGVWFVD